MFRNIDLFQKTILALGILAGLSLFGYALGYLIQMPAVSPDAFVPSSLTPSEGSIFGLIQPIFILGFSFSLLPVCILFTIKRYGHNPAGMILAASLLCIALLLEVIDNLPALANALYPEPLAQIPPEVQLHLQQMAAIRYLSLDVAGFTILYVAFFMYAIIFWTAKRTMGYLIIAGIVTFMTNVPFLWLSGNAAITLMAVSVICLVPVPIYFGKMAIE